MAMSVHACGWRGRMPIIFSFCLPRCLGTRSLSKPEIHHFAETGWPAKSQDHPVLPPNAGITSTHSLCLPFLCGCLSFEPRSSYLQNNLTHWSITQASLLWILFAKNICLIQSHKSFFLMLFLWKWYSVGSTFIEQKLLLIFVCGVRCAS